MTKMDNKSYLTFIFILSVVCCKKCVDKGWDELSINRFDVCGENHEWTFKETDINIDNQDNILNIHPHTQTTCVVSNTLSFVSGGVLEAEVYLQSITNEDYLKIIVFGDDNTVVGQSTLSGVIDGWHELKVTVGGVRIYDGFIMIISKTSLGSNITVESMCYHPTAQQEELSGNTSRTSFYDPPEMYALPTEPILKYPVYPNEDIKNIDVTVVKQRSFRIFDREDFWTPLTISLAVIIPVVLIALLCWMCYALGKSKGSKQNPQIMYEDIDNLPRPYLVPRVKGVYSESVAGSTYGGRNDNIYSV